MEDRRELIESHLVEDEQGRVYTVEVWAAVRYLDEFGMRTRTVGRRSFCLRDGSKLIKQRDDSFFNLSTGALLRRIT